ncbi:serine hydrolase domain-containing protein [Halomarina oriensis]|uniref:Serine hydrolase n=1 Tax=Halomarina oriensis TaxID=671145 RepID=A0A6B0GQD2_9EURY|nr:serine hydrolase domain-containing protein [Halomarina oriensis]MWG34873.1 serine hydrolase [Halomarina oriensis]
MAPRNSLPSTTVRDVERYLDDWRADVDGPGLGVAVVDRESLLYAEGFGDRSTDPQEPATPDTVYGVGSIAKVATAVAVLQLAERGALALDDPVSEHLPVLEDAPGDPVTVGDLLSHSSGLPRGFYAQREAMDRTELFEFVDDLARERVTDEDRYMYCNAGFVVLGELVASADGRAFPTYADEEMFTPLGMDRSTFDPAAVPDDDLMTGHHPDGTPTSIEAFADDFRHAGPSGGLLSTVRDLGTLLRWLLNRGELDGRRVLESESVEAMTTRQSPPLPTVDGTAPGYGYGLEVSECLGEPLVEHQGGIHVSGGYVGALPERGYGVAVACNGTARGIVSTGKAILALVCGERPEEAVRLLAARERVAAVTGTYGTGRSEMTVEVEPGPLGTVQVTAEGRDLSFTASPVWDDPPYSYAVAMGGGVCWRADFHETAVGMDLLLSTGKWTTRLSRK